MVSLTGLIESIASARSLLKQVAGLRSSRTSSSSEEFAQLLANFEIEVDRLKDVLIEQFGEDPNVMQVIFELKSAIIALKASNVEMSAG